MQLCPGMLSSSRWPQKPRPTYPKRTSYSLTGTLQPWVHAQVIQTLCGFRLVLCWAWAGVVLRSWSCSWLSGRGGGLQDSRSLSPLSPGFYTGWLLPAAVVGMVVFITGIFLMSNDVPS